jgi:hypothetical protein
MKRIAIIATILLALLCAIFVPARVATVSAVRKIQALEGQTGEFSSLVSSIRTHYTDVRDQKQIESYCGKLGLRDASGLRLVRFNGEGMPYFYGYVAYDTNKQTVVRAVVDELW